MTCTHIQCNQRKNPSTVSYSRPLIKSKWRHFTNTIKSNLEVNVSLLKIIIKITSSQICQHERKPPRKETLHFPQYTRNRNKPCNKESRYFTNLFSNISSSITLLIRLHTKAGLDIYRNQVNIEPIVYRKALKQRDWTTVHQVDICPMITDFIQMYV